ncbi:MAG: FkbM family methyltransferase [Cyclobacteriaceae bacterium]
MDCGANRGDITALFARTGATVYAFEPDPVAFRRLSQRFSSHQNVKCLQKAVWITNSFLSFYLHEAHDGCDLDVTVSSSLIREKRNVSEKQVLTVEAIDLLAFIRQLQKPVSIIKMDVEGAEIEIIDQLISEKLYNQVGLILVETHETKIPNQLEPLKRIKERISAQNIQNIRLNWV